MMICMVMMLMIGISSITNAEDTGVSIRITGHALSLKDKIEVIYYAAVEGEPVSCAGSDASPRAGSAGMQFYLHHV